MKRITGFLLIGLLTAAVGLAGCGTAVDAPEPDSTTPAAVETPQAQGLQYGQIKSQGDSTITITLGTMVSMQPPEGQKGQPKDGQTTPPALQPDSQASQSDVRDQQRPAKPEGEAPLNEQTPPDGENASSQPAGQTPPDRSAAEFANKSSITLTDETLTITVSDTTTVGYMNNSTSTAAISDLSVGTTIAVSLGEDGKTATQILIIK